MDKMFLPCGSTAYYDEESTCHSYRCKNCLAVVGSMGMPKHCQDQAEKYQVLAALGGQGWEYFPAAEELTDDQE